MINPIATQFLIGLLFNTVLINYPTLYFVQGCNSSLTLKEEKVLLYIEYQAVVQLLLQQLAVSLKDSRKTQDVSQTESVSIWPNAVNEVNGNKLVLQYM